jgi:transcriptional regulator with XRE-family HTH domain
MSDTKSRRKALGWSRRDLAERTALDKRIIQLVELGQWTESEALGRVEYVLSAGEAGDLELRLPPLEEPTGSD